MKTLKFLLTLLIFFVMDLMSYPYIAEAQTKKPNILVLERNSDLGGLYTVTRMAALKIRVR